MSDEQMAAFANFTQAERQAWITAQILEQGSVQVDELAERFQVSRMTIHRDLDDLEAQGVLRKVRNGATAQPSSLFESDIRYRIHRNTKEKEAMCRAVMQYIEPGQAIFLDEATTLLPLVRLLPAVAPLTVITNFLPILNELSACKGIHLIALGGEYLPRFDTFTGLLTEQTMATLHADAFITSTTAAFQGVAYHPDQQVVRVKKAMIAHSTKQFLLIDHTKFGKTALHEVAPLQSFERVVVDAGVDTERLEHLRAMGVKVEVAAPEA
jgi:DeoR/GlpR family transcriptional regulator of sugar metabolism